MTISEKKKNISHTQPNKQTNKQINLSNADFRKNFNR